MTIAQASASINPSVKNNVVAFPVLPLAAGFAVRDSVRRLDAFCKAVLYSLAMRMPNCWPSVERVARDSGMSVRKAQTVLARLEREGVVRRVRQDGRYGTNTYELDLDALREGRTDRGQGCTACGSEGCTLCTLRGNGEKRQDQKRADGEPQVSDRRPEPLPGRPTPVPKNTPAPTPVIPPPAQAEPGHREGGDPTPCTPPESGRFELPDVCIEEPKAVDREVAAMRRRSDLGEALVSEAKHVAAAFDVGHEAVYGFQSPELRGPKLWKCAVSAAQRLVDEFFDGDLGEAERYVVWAWERERRARKAGRERDRPVGWRLMFGPMAADYLKFRADRARRAA